MNPLISIIIPTYNSATTIKKAVESIMNQTYKYVEIIIIDDSSTDNTKDIVNELAQRDPRISYYKLDWQDPYPRVNKKGRNINAGYLARNFGFTKAKGEWITFQDSDDASFLNRIEIQYKYILKFNALHLSIDWQRFDENLIEKKFDIEKFTATNQIKIMQSDEIFKLSQKTKGLAYSILGKLCEYISFDIKTKKVLNKFFFRSLTPYPGTGNSPLFHKSILEKVLFRPLPKRVWPSFTGRGADRDFNFQVAETFKKSVTVFIPLYLWRTPNQNKTYTNPEIYI